MKMLAATGPSAVPCPICSARADLYGVVDFHKSCIESQNMRLELSGIPVYYRRCADCRFVFTGAFDDWTPADFAQYIYNEDYARIDPDYTSSRADQNATSLDLLLQSGKNELRLIDYGGGSGRLAESLRALGYDAETFDPFSAHNARPAHKADIVTAFEVMEHSNRPHEILEDMASLLNPGGLILFSTVLQPPDFDRVGLGWWYVGPRNGHISIYSRAALERLFNARGFAVVSVADRMHLACKGPSKWIEVFFGNKVEKTSAA